MGTWQDIFAAKIEDMHLEEPWILQKDNSLQVYILKPGWKEFVQHRVLGRFQCSQCFREWSSAKAHILFHICWHQGWGEVRMRPFRQACRRCVDPQLEEPEFSQETMEKVLHNLVLKILKYFYRVSIQTSSLLEVVVDLQVVGPHDSTRCEGCQLGVCSQSRVALALDTWEPVMDTWEPVMDTWEPEMDAWEPMMDTWEPVMDAQEPVMDADEARTHCTQGMRPRAAPARQHPPFVSSFPWKRCCFIGGSLLCVLAALLLVRGMTRLPRLTGGQGHTGYLSRTPRPKASMRLWI